MNLTSTLPDSMFLPALRGGEAAKAAAPASAAAGSSSRPRVFPAGGARESSRHAQAGAEHAKIADRLEEAGHPAAEHHRHMQYFNMAMASAHAPHESHRSGEFVKQARGHLDSADHALRSNPPGKSHGPRYMNDHDGMVLWFRGRYGQ